MSTAEHDIRPGEIALTLPETFDAGVYFIGRIGTPWTRSAIGAAVRKAGRVAGLSGRIAYGYRHGFATDALAAGVPDAHVAELLGHASTAMLHRHYSHLASRSAMLVTAAARVRGSASEAAG